MIDVNEDALGIQVVRGQTDDADTLHELTLRLRTTLLELDVKRVDPTPAEGPDGAKGVGTVLGSLMVSLGAAERLSRVLKTIGAWVRRNDRAVEISIGNSTLKLSNVSAEEQSRLIDAWLAQNVPAN